MKKSDILTTTAASDNAVLPSRRKFICGCCSAVPALSLAGSGLLASFALTGCDSGKQGAGTVGSTAGDAPQPEGLETVKLAYLPITHALPLFAAKELAEQGKIKPRVNVELVKFSSWPELTDALNTGRVDGASILIELALKAREQGIDLKAVALGHHDGNVVIAKPEINSAEDFKGKTFAIPHRISSHNILLQQMLSNAGMSLADVNVVELPPPEMPSALAQGTIDGYCVAEPFGAKAVTLGVGKVLFNSDALWKNSFCCGLVLNNAFITARLETAKRLTAQYEEAGNLLGSDPATPFNIAKKYLTVDDATLKQSLEWVSYNDLAISKESYDVLTEKMVRFDLTGNPPTYEDFVAKDLST